jgi:hypothetical protein
VIKIEDLFKEYRPMAAFGAVLVFTGAIILVGAPISGARTLLEAIMKLGLAGGVGLLFISLGVLLLLYRVAELAGEKKALSNIESITNEDETLIREMISSFNRQAFTNLDTTDEDLRSMFSGIDQARVMIQKTRERLSNTMIKGLLKILEGKLLEISTLSPWGFEAIPVPPNTERVARDRDDVTAAHFLEGSRRSQKKIRRYFRKYPPYGALMLEVNARKLPLVGWIQVIGKLLDEPLLKKVTDLD